MLTELRGLGRSWRWPPVLNKQVGEIWRDAEPVKAFMQMPLECESFEGLVDSFDHTITTTARCLPACLLKLASATMSAVSGLLPCLRHLIPSLLRHHTQHTTSSATPQASLVAVSEGQHDWHIQGSHVCPPGGWLQKIAWATALKT